MKTYKYCCILFFLDKIAIPFNIPKGKMSSDSSLSSSQVPRTYVCQNLTSPFLYL